MDRTEYLNLCKKVSELPHIPDDCLVEYEGVTYYPKAYQLSFNNGTTVHTAILHDVKAKSVMYCPLDKVIKK
jgi:hypothetical protein